MKKLINIPKNDLRKYGYGILKNKLKYSLVQDDNIDQSSVCVSVKTGSINDPIEYQGLAHFLEHMLFLGSEKYPEEDSFDSTLKSNGGFSNAWTDTFETVYFFTVNNNKLEKMIDMFSRFFIDPLFDINSVEREVKAVNSEHNKNINQDWWRIHYITNIISKKNSKINKFGTGNLETLNKKGVRERMKKFYNDYYCSDNISVSIISSIKLKKQESYIKKYFNEIKYKKSKKLKLNKPFYEKNTDSYHIVSVGKMNQLIYLWEVPYWEEDKKYNSWGIINSVILDEGKESLETFLKSKGLIKSLSVYKKEIGLYTLIIDMIKLDDNKIREVNSYISYFLNELKNLNWKEISLYNKKNKELIFNNGSRQDAMDLVQNLSINALYYPMENILSTELIKVIDEKRIKKLIEEYLNIDNFFKIKLNKKIRKIKYKTDKYYNSKYGKIKKIISDPKKFNFKFNTCNSFLDIKPKNIKINTKNNIPYLLDYRIWFGAVSKFKEPVFYSKYIFYSNNYINKVENYLINTLLVDSLNYYISRNYSQEFKIGFNINLSLSNTYGCLILTINGFNDKFNLLFDNIMNYLKNIVIEKYIFDSIYKRIKKYLYNFNKLSSWDYAGEMLNEQSNRYEYTIEKLSKTLKKIKLVDVNNNIKKLFNNKLEFFYYGNIIEEYLPNLDIFKKNLSKKKIKLFSFRVPKTMTYKHPNPKEKHNCLVNLYPCGKYNPIKDLKIIFISNIISQPFFDNLRTKEQLGYRVGFSIRKVDNKWYLIEKIESSYDINYIKEKLKVFRNIFYKEKLLEMDNKTWNNWKKTVHTNLSIREESTSELFSKYYSSILKRTYLFNYDELLLKNIKNIKLNDIQDYYKKMVLNNKNKIEIKVLKK